MQEIKKLGVLSTAKITLLFGVLFGLVAGLTVATASATLPAEAIPAGFGEYIYGWYAVIILPILYGIGYFISGLLGAVFYNLFVKWVGGIKVDFGTAKKK
jgi:hypothetical protein